MKEIVAYFRVSTKSQGIEGLGMAAQREAVGRYAASIGSTIVAAYEEVESSSRADLRNRPKLASALAHVRRSKAVLVIARLDRLARNVYVTSQLLESGIEFVACDNPQASRLTIHILAAMAEHESRLISARVKAAMAAARARGVEPYRGSRLSPEAILAGVEASRAATLRRTREVYADLVPLLRSLRAEGRSHRSIANELNVQGQRNQFGGVWKRDSIRRFLKREGLSHMKASRGRENHLTGRIQRAGVMASATARAQRSRAYYEPYLPLLRDLYKAGLSSVAIARELDTRGIKTQGGSRWYPSIVQQTMRRAGIAPPARAGHVGLRDPDVQRTGRLAASIRISALAASHRGRIMPIIRWLQATGLNFAAVATYLNDHDYQPSRGHAWSRRSVSQFALRDSNRRCERVHLGDDHSAAIWPC